MPLYHYRARAKNGETKEGVIETTSQDAALDTLQQSGLFVVSLKTQAEETSIFRFNIKITGHISQKDVVLFSRELATLFQAHIPIVEALKTLIAETSRPALKKIISDILDDVSGGMALSQAFSRHPEAFTSFYINLVRSGEESGKLQDVFVYLADYLERNYYLTTKTRNSLIYPAFIVFAFAVVVSILMIYVIPQLVQIFQNSGQEIPWYTQIIIFISLFMRTWSPLLLLLFIGGCIFLWRWSFTEKGRYTLHRLQLSVPLIGAIYQKLYMTRLADNLQTLVSSGIPIMRALSITGDVVGNEIYKRAVDQAIESVKGGGTISAAFEKFPEIPALVTQMIRIGEASGKLDFILGKIAQFYKREVDSLVDNLIALIEPALIVVLGLGIGILVASIMVPFYNLVGGIS